MVNTVSGEGRRPVPWGPGRHWRGGGKAGRVCIRRPPELRDMLLVRDDPDRADLTPLQLEMRQLLVERPGAFVARLSALEEQHRAAVREAEERRRSRRKGGAAAARAPAEEDICDGPTGGPVARRADRLECLFIPEGLLIECLMNAKMRVEGLYPFDFVSCRYDPVRKGVLILARSSLFDVVPAGARVPESVVERGKWGRLFRRPR